MTSNRELTGPAWLGHAFEPVSITVAGDGTIERVDATPCPGAVRRLLLPGFVNAHVHLDLTWYRSGDALAGTFEDWLLDVHAQRQSKGPEGLSDSVRLGVEESIASGTIAVVDYDASRQAAAAIADSALRRVLLLECIAFDDTREAKLELELERYWSEPTPPHELRGVAPHAPYTTRAEFQARLMERATTAGRISSMHLSEQPYEREFLRDGTGPIRALYETMGVNYDVAHFGGPESLPRLEAKGCLTNRFLAVHGNYLEAEDIEVLRRSGSTVVFCPRSHRFFGHAPYPLPELLEAGVRCALGTDGKVSAGSLSVLDELREVRAQYPWLAGADLLSLVTTSAHDAIGGAFGSGRLEAGAPADIIEIEFDSTVGRDHALETLLEGNGHVVRTWIGGALVHGDA